MLRSQLCSVESLRSPALVAWAQRLRPMWARTDEDPRDVLLHRKMWEWLFIAEALHERGLLGPGHSGLGFGVGQEPLVALFVAQGCELVATDQPQELAVSTGWTDSAVEWAGGLENLNTFGLCPEDDFVRRVRYRDVDMNAIPRPTRLRLHVVLVRPRAPGHAGVRDGVRGQPDGLPRARRDGGAHDGVSRLVQRRDGRGGGHRLLPAPRHRGDERPPAGGRHILDIDYREGTSPEDLHVDVPPYTDVHLRTRLGGYVTTSMALIVTKGSSGPGRIRSLLRRARRD